MVDHYVDQVVRCRVDRYLTGVGDPVDNLSAFFASAVTAPPNGGPLIGCLLTTVAAETPHLDRTVQRALDRGIASITGPERS